MSFRGARNWRDVFPITSGVGRFWFDVQDPRLSIINLGSVTNPITIFDRSYLQDTTECVTDVVWEYSNGIGRKELQTVEGTSSNDIVLSWVPGTSHWQCHLSEAGSEEVTLTYTCPARTTEVTLTVSNTTEVVNQFTEFASGSLAAHCADQIDSRIIGGNPETGLPIYSQISPSSIIRNSSCWMDDIDISPLGVLSSFTGTQHTATLISNKAVLMANHASLLPGTTVYFRSAAGAIVTKTVTALHFVGGDLIIGALDSTVSISPMKVPPANLMDYMPAFVTITYEDGLTTYTTPFSYPVPHLCPFVTLDQERRAFVAALNYTISSNSQIYQIGPAWIGGSGLIGDELRSQWEGSFSIGDGGCPSFLLINDEPVLVSLNTFTLGAGPYIPSWRTAIEAVLSAYSLGSLTTASLTGFTNYGPF